MSWRSWTDYGYGIPLQNDRNFETIKEFIIKRLSQEDDRIPELKDAEDEYDIYDLFDQPLAHLIASMIRQETGYNTFKGFDSCGDTDQVAYIGFGECLPWEIGEKDKELTRYIAWDLLSKYSKELGINELPGDFIAYYCG